MRMFPAFRLTCVLRGAAGGVLGYLYGATSTMVVGCVAAGAAFGLVKAMGVKE